jgi:nucleoside-diphosphate-sugar epimerase
VHGAADHGFAATLVGIARAKGVSGYITDGADRWPAVHRLDAARLVRLAVENAPAESTLHAVAEQGIATRSIAEAIGRGLELTGSSWVGSRPSGDSTSTSMRGITSRPRPRNGRRGGHYHVRVRVRVTTFRTGALRVTCPAHELRRD